MINFNPNNQPKVISLLFVCYTWHLVSSLMVNREKGIVGYDLTISIINEFLPAMKSILYPKTATQYVCYTVIDCEV